ncbi:hypothetical protein SAMN04488490_1121 [Marinobacter sp. LV10R510-11A]|uniref:hypothetical protein n=1 Tax=Marinobacter sp. LV10R510-11A TaxID=1415568 RepID=UPI000BB81CF4|nr:hypothetical protein [Marinobacter sp. LV10R510-11A]SOB75514.1 hypothetical protein SAMN04488490_1121 [Marinobacter sp. LV10R510-11A]
MLRCYEYLVKEADRSGHIKRIKLINSLLEQDTEQSLTYAALESRLTLEYLCYERFKLYFSYLSESDLKNWQPKHIIKQISDEVDDNVSKEFSISISDEKIDERSPETREEFESIKYTPLGNQSELKFNKLHQLWHGVSNVALHIPVPSITSRNLNIYGDKDNIRKKVSGVVSFLSGMKGNLLMGGSFGEEYGFNCFACDTKIKRPVKNLQNQTVLSCINPNCQESYVIKKDKNGDFEVIRSIIMFSCSGCNEDLEVPIRVFRDLRFNQTLNINCGKCNTLSEVIMRPLIKSTEAEHPHNKALQRTSG